MLGDSLQRLVARGGRAGTLRQGGRDLENSLGVGARVLDHSGLIGCLDGQVLAGFRHFLGRGGHLLGTGGDLLRHRRGFVGRRVDGAHQCREGADHLVHRADEVVHLVATAFLGHGVDGEVATGDALRHRAGCLNRLGDPGVEPIGEGEEHDEREGDHDAAGDVTGRAHSRGRRPRDGAGLTGQDPP